MLLNKRIVSTLLATLWLSFAVIGCAYSAEQRSTAETVDDGVLTTRIKAALIANDQTKARQIDVETYRGQVQLNGFVDSDTARTEAEITASNVKGVQAVKNNLQIRAAERTTGRVVDDAMITTKVKTAFVGDPRTKASQIEVTTNAGVVELGGFVDTVEAKNVAAQLAYAIDGVNTVRNRLHVR